MSAEMDFTRLHRFFVRAECVCDGRVRFDGPQSKQICNVLRLRSGDNVAVIDGSGCGLVVRITEASPAAVRGDVLERCPIETEPRVNLTIAIALPKADKLEFTIQKGTELGVVKFEILKSARTIARPTNERIAGRLARWQAIAKEAAEQSCRAIIPEISGITPIEEFASEIANYDLAVCLWEEEQRTTFREVLNSKKSAENIVLIIGPEGGFEECEVRMMQEHGALAATLGRRVLRCETAAVSAAAIALYELESCSSR